MKPNLLSRAIAPLLWCALPALLVTGSSHALEPTHDKASAERAAFETKALRADFPNARISTDPKSGQARFVRFAQGGGYQSKSNASATESAEAFLARYGQAFGIQHAGSELALTAWAEDRTSGGRRLVYQQLFQGVPVYGGEIRVHTDARQRVRAVNGKFLTDIRADAVATLDAGTAGKAAAAAEIESIKATLPASKIIGPVVYRTGLARGVPGTDHLAYRVEIGGNGKPRQFLFVDAHTGSVIDRIAGSHSIQRDLYELDDLTEEYNLIWTEGESTAALNSTQQESLDYAEQTHNLFASISQGSYRGFDGLDATMRTNLGFPKYTLPEEVSMCPNAWWDGSAITLCRAHFGQDDVIAHEWSHAYTQYTHDLVYQWEPGALNESYSDIFGELVDIANGIGTDDASFATRRTGCTTSTGGTDPSYRWLIGEDNSDVLRDMWDPTCIADFETLANPDKMSSPYYYCGQQDAGGVHFNSGVPNHAFALAHDGGTFNGYTVSALGKDRMAAIYWRAMTEYQGIHSTFSDHADALEASCDDLIGQPLGLVATTGTIAVSPQVITATHCAELAEAISAVELRGEPTCTYEHVLPEGVSPLHCPTGRAGAVSRQAFSTDPGWTKMNYGAVPEDWTARNWKWVDALPGGRSGGMFARADSTFGNCTTDDESGVMTLYADAFTVRASNNVMVSFTHALATEYETDGGDVQISVNGGPYETVSKSKFERNPYNGLIREDFFGLVTNTNPIAGGRAFTGMDIDNLDPTNPGWGTSVINLTGLAVEGDSVRLRFRMGVDGCGGVVGWYIDDFRTYVCQ